MSDNFSQVEGSALQVCTLGGGSFWCLEMVFQQMRGVKLVESGYSGGRNANPETKGHSLCLIGERTNNDLAFYDARRLHSRLGYVSPMQFEKNWLAEQARRSA